MTRKKENLSQPGAVLIEEAFIVTKDGTTFSLKNFIAEICVYEHINMNGMHADITIVDSNGLITAASILGEETVVIEFRTPTFQDKFNRNFVVYSIVNRLVNNDREQFYTLKCVTPELYADNFVRLTSKFSGATDELVQNVFDQIKIKRGKTNKAKDSELFIAETPHASTNYEFIANHWSPFKCLNHLATKSIGKESNKSNFKFFENKSGFFFASPESLVRAQKKNRAVYDEYNIQQNQTQEVREDKRNGGYNYVSPFISSRFNQVESIYYPSFKDNIRSQMDGYTASSIYSYDFTTKRLAVMKFDGRPESKEIAKEDRRYISETFDDFETISKINPIPEQTLGNPLANRTFSPMATSPYATTFSRGVDQIRNTLIRRYGDAELEDNVMEITVPGKTDVETGLLVRLIYPQTKELGQTAIDRTELEDPYISGIYLIIGVRHDIQNGQHSMTLSLMKDSLGDF